MTLSVESAAKALSTKGKIKVLVVDDSALIRSLLTEMINSQNDMVVVAAAPDPIIARDLIKQHNPDVITLDVEMPKMDGLDFLERLMRLRPTPVVMVSTLTEKGSEITLRALELGAIDFVTKPKMAISSGLKDYKDLIAEKIRIASQAKLSAKSISKPDNSSINRASLKNPLMSSEKLIIIGSSTGGTEAVKTFLLGLPADSPGVLITQHMPAGFTKSFADRLNNLTSLNVKEAEDGERVMPGCAYIAPGDRHMRLNKSGANYTIALSDEEPVSRHRPSVDVLFESAAQHAGKNGIGLILTGMGKDGAAGMLKMKEAGAYNFAQDENSCVVFGMPKEAIAHGGVDYVADIKEMAVKVIGHINATGGRSLRV